MASPWTRSGGCVAGLQRRGDRRQRDQRHRRTSPDGEDADARERQPGPDRMHGEDDGRRVPRGSALRGQVRPHQTDEGAACGDEHADQRDPGRDAECRRLPDCRPGAGRRAAAAPRPASAIRSPPPPPLPIRSNVHPLFLMAFVSIVGERSSSVRATYSSSFVNGSGVRATSSAESDAGRSPARLAMEEGPLRGGARPDVEQVLSGLVLHHPGEDERVRRRTPPCRLRRSSCARLPVPVRPAWPRRRRYPTGRPGRGSRPGRRSSGSACRPPRGPSRPDARTSPAPCARRGVMVMRDWPDMNPPGTNATWSMSVAAVSTSLAGSIATSSPLGARTASFSPSGNTSAA